MSPLEARTCAQCGSSFETTHYSKRFCQKLCKHRWDKAQRTPDTPEALRERGLRRRYGMTSADYAAKLAEQGGVCAICGASQPNGRFQTFVIDHDHRCCAEITTCGRCVRGIVCCNCNLLLGKANDDPARLRAAIDYLEWWAV